MQWPCPIPPQALQEDPQQLANPSSQPPSAARGHFPFTGVKTEARGQSRVTVRGDRMGFEIQADPSGQTLGRQERIWAHPALETPPPPTHTHTRKSSHPGPKGGPALLAAPASWGPRKPRPTDGSSVRKATSSREPPSMALAAASGPALEPTPPTDPSRGQPEERAPWDQGQEHRPLGSRTTLRP